MIYTVLQFFPPKDNKFEPKNKFRAKFPFPDEYIKHASKCK
jgi:hypothetical protein